jgi:hypothetical protein
LTVGVGQDEDPLALMGGTDIGRSYSTPLRIEPERGKVPENGVHAPSKETADVLHEDVAGS